MTVHHQHNNAITQVDINTILVWCNPRERIARYNAAFSLPIVGVSMYVKPLSLYIRFGEPTTFLRTKHIHIYPAKVIQHNRSGLPHQILCSKFQRLGCYTCCPSSSNFSICISRHFNIVSLSTAYIQRKSHRYRYPYVLFSRNRMSDMQRSIHSKGSGAHIRKHITYILLGHTLIGLSGCYRKILIFTVMLRFDMSIRNRRSSIRKSHRIYCNIRSRLRILLQNDLRCTRSKSNLHRCRRSSYTKCTIFFITSTDKHRHRIS